MSRLVRDDVGVPHLYDIKINSIWTYVCMQSLSFWFLNAYLFLEYVRPQSIYAPLEDLPLAQISLIATLFALIVEGQIGKIANPENRLIVAFMGVVLVSSVFAYSPEISFTFLREFLIWFVVYFLIISVINTERRFFVFLLAFVLYNFKMTQHGFISWAGRGFAYTNWGVTGAPGWFHNSGEFGIQLSMFLPIIVCFNIGLWPYWNGIRKVFFTLMPVTGLGSVVATSSRGALIGVAAAFSWLVGASRMKWRALVIVAAVGIVVANVIPEEFVARLETSGADQTSFQRLERWADGVEMMNDHPILGIGYYNWEYYYRLSYDPMWGHGLSHNIFVQAGAELGYTGLLLFLLMILYVFVNNLRTRRMARQMNHRLFVLLAYGFDGALIGFLISGFFVTVLYYPYFWIHMAFVVALNNVTKNLQREMGKRKQISVSRNHLLPDRPPDTRRQVGYR